MPEKACTCCGIVKPFELFPPSKKIASGRVARCRDCTAAAKRKFAQDHKEESKARTQRYYLENKERLLANMKAYREENADRLFEYQKEYAGKHQARLREQKAAYYRANQGVIKTRASGHHRYRYKALKDEILAILGGKCFCCGLDNRSFLTIDHSEGNGREDRFKENGKSRNSYQSLLIMYRKIIAGDSTYRAACYNCNCARQYTEDKICPHMIGK